ncbi:MAG: ribonuclease Y [Spirochaetaceae bacterium]|nr:ribonuclease Y [Spirochaetaceae bacterium]
MQQLLYVLIPLSFILGWIVRWLYARYQLTSSEQRAVRLKQDAVKEAETEKKEILLNAQEQILRERKQLDKEMRERKSEQQRAENRLQSKEDNLEKKVQVIEKRANALTGREKELTLKEEELDELKQSQLAELEKIASVSAEDAKAMLITQLTDKAKHEARSFIAKIEAEAKETAERKAREMLLSVIQRIATEVSSETTVASVALPNDEMKGRIIGREGRNIRTLETLTGVDIIIDDTPEAVVISAFDPVRKAIAKMAMEKLVTDGRIHPNRIEEVVGKVTKEVNQKVYEEGERAAFELGVHGLNNELIRALGRLYFRTSYGQNVLYHSKEVAALAGMLAAELGCNREIAKRAALLHDIGKGIEVDGDGNHAEAGAELLKKLGEKENVIHAVLAHHNDIEVKTMEAVIVQIADAISAGRPGARRESLETYVKRLENLEKIATSYTGVEKAFAVQAGRELRIIVNNEEVNDEQMKEMGHDIAGRIENELKYPGRIRITLVRESRVIEYAK